MEVVVSDSTSIMTLLRIDRLDILSHIFQTVYLPPVVYAEISHKTTLDSSHSLFTIMPIADTALYTLLTRSLDAGESEAIVLAKERGLSLIIDEKKGRKIASNLGINITGLLGLLLLNHKKGFLTVSEILALFSEIQDAGFYVSERLVVMFESALKEGK